MTFGRTLLVTAVGFVCCACGDDGAQTAAADLAAPASNDLAVAAVDDLARVYDMTRDWSFSFADASGFCEGGADAGNSVAGTCVQSFFSKLAECWVPAGMCSVAQISNSDTTWCWESGAGELVNANLVAQQTLLRKLVRGQTACMKWTPTQSGADGLWTAPDGTQLTLIVATGEVTCPDGSHVTIGPNYGNCDELHRLLRPEQNQTCPANNSSVSCPPSWL